MLYRIIILAALLSACGAEETSTLDIIGGEKMPTDKTKIGTIPSAIGIATNVGGCTGVRISDNTYLTAAHCFTGAGAETDGVVYASNTLPVMARFTNIRRNPTYVDTNNTEGRGTDMALFTLQFSSKPLKAEWDKFVVPAKIDYTLPMKGRDVILVGYGCEKRDFPWFDAISECAKSPGFAYMKTAKSKVLDVPSHYFNLDGSTGKEGITGFISNGDSGSPVYSESGAVIGITSSSSGRPLGGLIVGGDGFGITTQHSWIGYRGVQAWIESALSADASISPFAPYMAFASVDYPEGKYIGEMRDGLRSGTGNMHYHDGRFYHGDWALDVRQGTGTQTWSDDPKYVDYMGGWENNLPSGKGRQSYKDGTIYDGFYKAGRYHGAGVITYPNGDRREGSWSENKMEGVIILTTASGEKWQETYSGGKRVSAVKI